ncbi:MAG: flagellar motor protein MotB [Bacteriovoracia bacterium]
MSEKEKPELVPDEDYRPLFHVSELSSAKTEKTWMLSYMDLMSLLLILFVFLISTANFEEPGSKGAGGMGKSDPANNTDIFSMRGRGYESKLEYIRGQISESGLSEKVQLNLTDKKVELVLGSRFLFPSGSADITHEGHSILESIVPILTSLNGEIAIEGHTDNLPISNELYPSNWELSSARSSRVARMLIESGINERKIKVIGFADKRPIASNLSEEGREKNRRVMISVEPN